MKKKFNNYYRYYLWCKYINKDDADYKYFISLNLNSYNYYD